MARGVLVHGVRAVLCACVALWCAGASSVAKAQTGLEPLRGFGFDLEIDGGVGFAFRSRLDNDFLGRARVGVLYVHEPWSYALGVTGEVGALAGYGVGVTAAVSHFDGPWARVGGSRVEGGDWMSHLALGYLFFGIEWQHRFDSVQPATDALLLVFRVPVGLWWFLSRNDEPPVTGSSLRSMPQQEPDARDDVRSVSAGDRLLSARFVDEAVLMEQQERWSEAAELLSRASQLDPTPLLTLRLARAERRAGRLVAASDNLRRFIDAAVTPEELDARTDAERERLETLSQLATLRLRVEPLPDDAVVFLDGRPFSVAALGYPYPIDPGNHVVEVRQGDTLLLHHELSAQPGENVHLKLDPSTTPGPSPTPAP